MTRTALDPFLERKERQVREAAARRPAGSLERARRRALAAPAVPALERTLRAGPNVALIAEFKRRSPSGGRLLRQERPRDVAAAYVEAGAAALSVLTDASDFGGSLNDLRQVAEAGSAPVLRKDFVVDAAGLYQAREAGASAALLIAAMLRDDELEPLLVAAGDVGLECLVEVHGEAELDRALAADATLIGVNNRDLRRLETDLRVTERLAPLVPADRTLVSESGIASAGDVARVRDAGAHAVLVGGALLALPPEARAELARTMTSVPRAVSAQARRSSSAGVQR